MMKQTMTRTRQKQLRGDKMRKTIMVLAVVCLAVFLAGCNQGVIPPSSQPSTSVDSGLSDIDSLDDDLGLSDLESLERDFDVVI